MGKLTKAYEDKYNNLNLEELAEEVHEIFNEQSEAHESIELLDKELYDRLSDIQHNSEELFNDFVSLLTSGEIIILRNNILEDIRMSINELYMKACKGEPYRVLVKQTLVKSKQKRKDNE